FGGADAIGLLADLPAALRMHYDLDVWILGSDSVDMLRQEALVYRAVAFPKNNLGLAQFGGGDASHNHVRVPDHALLQRNSHGIRRIAAQMLIGKKEDLFITLQRPLEGPHRVGRCAYQSATLTAESLD